MPHTFLQHRFDQERKQRICSSIVTITSALGSWCLQSFVYTTSCLGEAPLKLPSSYHQTSVISHLWLLPSPFSLLAWLRTWPDCNNKGMKNGCTDPDVKAEVGGCAHHGGAAPTTHWLESFGPPPGLRHWEPLTWLDPYQAIYLGPHVPVTHPFRTSSDPHTFSLSPPPQFHFSFWDKVSCGSRWSATSDLPVSTSGAGTQMWTPRPT